MANQTDLCEGWSLTLAGDPDSVPEPLVARLTGDGIPATVPGCVHTDLLAADLIPDPYRDANEKQLTWIGRTDWRYRTTFRAPTGYHRVDLVCQGLDTVADIAVNDIPVGHTENMHRTYRFDLRPALREGDNQLSVTFTSAYAYAEAHRDRLGNLPNAYPEPFNFIRKMACNFGWDWGPTLVTAGIWRPIGLHAWNVARLEQVRPLVTVEEAEGTRRGRVRLPIRVERSGVGPATELTVTARLGEVVVTGSLAPDASELTLELVIDEPELWWPRGYGDQPLYEVAVVLSAGETELDTWRRRIGFRSVALDTTPDEIGQRFAIVINGEPIQVRGANWIPDDCFPSRLTPTRLEERIRQAREANINLLRVWGGGVYESEDFYRICDETGVLVWQDFLFACAAYPEESPLAEEVEAEARDNVVRLAHHPSLVLWNGNNECIVGWFEWGWQYYLQNRTWGRGYYAEVLPRVVAELDPTRPYLPGSPWSGSFDLSPDVYGYGTNHIWDVWNHRDYTAYREKLPRFAAEFGYQAPPTYATVRAALSDDPLAPDSPGMLAHQKAEDGNGKLWRGLRYHFPDPVGFDDWHYLTQVNQARAITLGVEHFRANWPVCTGTIIWQLNDCWPVTSWAAIDGAGRRKPLWYALRRSYADRLVTVQPSQDGLNVVIVNDSPEKWETEVRMERRDVDGSILATAVAPVQVPPRSVGKVPVPGDLVSPGDQARELLVATVDQTRGLWFYAEDRDLEYPSPGYDVAVEGEQVTITAHTLLRDVVLQVDRLAPDATVDDGMFTLLPGETRTVTVRGVDGLDAAAVRRVLWVVNAVVLAARAGSASRA